MSGTITGGRPFPVMSKLRIAFIALVLVMAAVGRPVYNAAHVHAKIRQAIRQAGSCSAWGRGIGISKSYAFDVSSGIRSPSDRVLATLGLVKRGAGRDMYLEL